MKKNKRIRRIFSRVLDRLMWANVYRIHGGNENAYKEVLAAKKDLERFGCENVKVVFYDQEYHLTFEVYTPGYQCNRYYNASASNGYFNEYHVTNRDHVKALIDLAAYTLDCKLRRDFYAYQWFQTVADSVLFDGLAAYEYDGYCRNGKISDIPFDVAVSLWRELRGCMERIVDESVAHKGVQI